MMTLGFVLIFFGIQLNVVDSYVMTPRMSHFLSDNFSNNPPLVRPETNINLPPNINQPPFTQASYGQQAATAIPRPVAAFANVPSRVIRPPGWFGWPVMFLGAVFFLNGVIRR